MSSYIYEVIKTEPDIPAKCFSYTDPIGFLVPAHWHNSIEILQIQKGRLHVTLGEQKLVLETGCFLIVNSRVIHSTFCEKGTEAEVVQIPIPFLKKYLPGMEGRSFYTQPVNTCMKENGLSPDAPRQRKEDEESGPDRIGWLISKLNQLNRDRGETFLVRFHSLLFELMYQIYVCCSVPEQAGQINLDDVNRERLTKVMNYVNQNYRERITLEQTASLVALNKDYFCRFFRSNMGMPFVDYVNEVRFSHVCRELFETDHNIMTVLEDNGFTNYKLFMKMFRARYHMTPSRKRKEL